LPHIFEPFFRERSSEQPFGAGLGLAIVHWIVSEHGGKIAVESLAGRGTTVSITLPEYTVPS
jgi:signal transduction histidine kinase